MNVWPPAVIVPERGVDDVFAATVNDTVPLPEPPPVTVIQPTPLVAVHEQPVPAAIENEPLPPAAGIDCDAGEIAYVQATAAACVTDTT